VYYIFIFHIYIYIYIYSEFFIYKSVHVEIGCNRHLFAIDRFIYLSTEGFPCFAGMGRKIMADVGVNW